MQIRVATPLDGAAIARIYAPFVSDTVVSFEETAPDDAEMIRRIEEGLSVYPWLVAVDEGEVVGYAYASRHRARAAYRWAVDTSVYVDAAHRRRGVASALYRPLITLLEAQGYRTAHAGIALPNPASVGFHTSMGFGHVGIYHRVGWKLGRWHDVGWWQRPLGRGVDPPDEPASLEDIDALGIIGLYGQPR